jgi:hypothetical protein
VNEIEQGGCKALLTHPGKAKAMTANVNKTDKLDARGLITLLRNGTLPMVWIAPSEVRDGRELPRTCMALCKIRVALKNRIRTTLAKDKEVDINREQTARHGPFECGLQDQQQSGSQCQDQVDKGSFDKPAS